MSLDHIIDDNIVALMAGARVLENLTPKQFTLVSHPCFSASVGKHFRHILDHYLSLLRGISESVITYDNRIREQQLEQNLDCSLDAVRQIISQLTEIKTASVTAGPLKVILTTSPDNDSPDAVISSIERELIFLQSHTTHHYAIIASILKLLDVPVEKDFGVAPSTLIYERSRPCAQLPG